MTFDLILFIFSNHPSKTSSIPSLTGYKHCSFRPHLLQTTLSSNEQSMFPRQGPLHRKCSPHGTGIRPACAVPLPALIPLPAVNVVFNARSPRSVSPLLLQLKSARDSFFSDPTTSGSVKRYR